MPERDKNPVFDGAILSPKLKPADRADDSVISIPIGKSAGAGGASVARAYKHAAGKSSTYSPEVVDMIYHMSRNGTFDDDAIGSFVKAKLAAEREHPCDTAPRTWDQLVFLSANLTRLVIDPYREHCNSRVQIGAQRPKPLTLAWPVVFGGVDFVRLPQSLVGRFLAVTAQGSLAAFLDDEESSAIIPEGARAIVRVDAPLPLPDLQRAAAVEISAPRASLIRRPLIEETVNAAREATHGEIPIGLVTPACRAAEVVDETVTLDLDFYVADAQWTTDARPAGIFPELLGAPDIEVLAEGIDRLRHHCREETVQIIYRGGIRGGADAGKAIALGATAVSIGLSAVIGMGFRITQITDEVSLLQQIEDEQVADDVVEDHLHNFAKSVNLEVTMLARACGKSSVCNMEPEDMRALTSAVSAATGIPMVGKDVNFRQPLDERSNG